MIVKLLYLVPLIATVFVWCKEVDATVFHVSPDGNDAWSGRMPSSNADLSDGPLATLQGARDAVRALKARGALGAPVRIQFASGAYPLTEEVVFTPEDSGTAQCPITYECSQGAESVFSGGKPIGGWTEEDGIWKTHIQEVAEGQWYFEQLFVNGRRAARARTPNESYFYLLRRIDRGIDPLTGQEADLGSRSFQVEDGILQEWPNLQDVTVVVYHSWASSRLRLASVDLKQNIVTTTGPARWPFQRWDTRQRFHLESFREALDAPGEWYLERNGDLFYIPLPGEKIESVRVVAPVAESFVRFEGLPENNEFVEHISLNGLHFEHAQYVVPREGISDAQAAFSIPGVIMANGARHINIQKCEISKIGKYAIWFKKGCRDCLVQECYLHDLGAGGVRIGEGAMRHEKSQQTERIVVDNNIIHGCGRIFFEAVGVWIGQSGNNHVTHNDISDLLYTGISVGWRWGYSSSYSKNNTIDFNHIHHIGQGVLSDMGAVYTLGPSEGTTVSNNRIHDIYSYGYGGWGLYNDEGSTGIVMENNLVYNCKSACYHQHYGKENILRNNILAFGLENQIQRTREENHVSFVIENNIFLWKTGNLLGSNWEGSNYQFRNNLYWNASGSPVTFKGKSFQQWQQTGQDPGSLVADPKFVSPEEFDFSLDSDSPAAQIGFKPFDFNKAGVYGTKKWLERATHLKQPELQLPPVPPPARIKDDFESSPVGAAPILARVHVESKGDGIQVTDETAASGTRCLKIEDAPGLERAYNPHFYYRPSYSEGMMQFSFDMKIGPGVVMFHDWRDSASPYRVGPSFTISENKLHLPGQQGVDIPVGKWLHFQISTNLGASSTGTWELKLTVDKEKHLFEAMKNRDATWKELTWLGFSSTATEKTVFYLDNIELCSR